MYVMVMYLDALVTDLDVLVTYLDVLHRGFLGSSLVESENKKRRAGAGTAFSIMEPQYADMDRQAADKKARRYITLKAHGTHGHSSIATPTFGLGLLVNLLSTTFCTA